MKNDQDIFKTMEKHGGVVGAMIYHTEQLEKSLKDSGVDAYIHIEELHDLLQYARLTGVE